MDAAGGRVGDRSSPRRGIAGSDHDDGQHDDRHHDDRQDDGRSDYNRRACFDDLHYHRACFDDAGPACRLDHGRSMIARMVRKRALRARALRR